MKHLNKHLLDFDPTWKYVQDNLDQTNILSSELLKLINFNKGQFFTLLPNDANINFIYCFDCGLLPQNPIKYFANGATYSFKSSIREELSELIVKEMTSHKYLSCIYDDVNVSPLESKGYPLFDIYGLSYENETYYLFKNNEISIYWLKECLRISNSIWHSLGLFTTADFSRDAKALSLEEIKNICADTKLIMVGAYDGEGYVFWELQGFNFFQTSDKH